MRRGIGMARAALGAHDGQCPAAGKGVLCDLHAVGQVDQGEVMAIGKSPAANACHLLADHHILHAQSGEGLVGNRCQRGRKHQPLRANDHGAGR